MYLRKRPAYLTNTIHITPNSAMVYQLQTKIHPRGMWYYQHNRFILPRKTMIEQLSKSDVGFLVKEEQFCGRK